MSKEPNVFTGRPFSLLVRPSDITAPPVHNMNRFNPYTSAEKVDLGHELSKLREESVNLPPLPIDSEQLRVYVRLRPTDLPDDAVNNTYRIDGGQRLYVSVTNSGATAEHELKFSHIFSTKATQQEVFFGAARPLVFNFIAGDNALIFAYGCTSSGKTYTIEGTHDNPGVLPRCVQTIFSQLNVIEQHRLHPVRYNEFNILSARQAEAAASEKATLFSKIHAEGKPVHFEQDASTSCFFPDVLQQNGRQCSLFLGFVEIYNNNVYDLLGPAMQASENQFLVQKNPKAKPKVAGKAKQPAEPREALQVGEDINHNTYVKELRWVQVASAQEALELVAFAQRNMTFASTFFNMNSSRSHVICFIRLAYWSVKSEIDESMAMMETTGGYSSYLEEHTHQTLEVEKTSIMAICDLAGSERQPPQGHQIDRLREAGSINTDLLTLGQCLTGMHNNQIASRKLQSKNNPAAGAAAVVAKKKPTEEPVPYRSCRLTYLLKAFLVGGRARVAMISAIVPTVELIEQNMQVLRYAAFASEVVVYRKLEPAVIEKFQKAKQKQQSKAVARAARRLSQVPRARGLASGKKCVVSEGTPITEELVKIQEEMGDALDAQLVVMNGLNDTEILDKNDENEESDDSSEEESGDDESDDDENFEGEGANLSKAEVVRLLRKVCDECQRLHEENKKLVAAKDAAEIETKRQRGYYEMMKEKFKEAVEEIEEMRAARPSVDQCVDTEGLPPIPNRSDTILTRTLTKAPAIPRAERSGLIAALGLAEPSLHWQASQQQKTVLWADEDSCAKPPSQERIVEKRKVVDESDDESSKHSPTSHMSKRSRLETPVATALPHAVASERKERCNASPSTMPINKFSTHTKTSLLRMRMHQGNVIKERHNAVLLKTPVLHPTNPEDMSLDEAMPNMPAELTRRLEQIHHLKLQLTEMEREREKLQQQLEDIPSLDKFRRQDELVLRLKSDLEFEKQLCQQNATEAEALRSENVELKTAYENAKKLEHSLSEELARRVKEIGHLKERIVELQQDLQNVYDEINQSRAVKESELQQQVDGLRADCEKSKSECLEKNRELESLKSELKTAKNQLHALERERQDLLEEARKKPDRGNTTVRLEDLQFESDEVALELESTKEKVRNLEDQIQAKTSRVAELQKLADLKSEEVFRLEGRVDELHRTISENADRYNKEREVLEKRHEDTIRDFDAARQLLEAELRQKTDEVSEIKGKLAAMEAMVHELTNSRTNADQMSAAKVAELEAAYQAAMSDLTAKSSEIVILSEKMSLFETKLAKLKELEVEHQRMNDELAVKSAEASNLSSKILELEAALSNHSKRIVDIQAEMAALASEKAKVIAQLELEKDELKAEKLEEYTRLTANIVELEAEIRIKSADYEHLSNRFAAVEAELIDARQEIDRCKAEFDAERSILTKTCEDDARSILDQKLLLISKLEIRLDDAEKTINNQKRQIKDLTEENAVKTAKLECTVTKISAENAALLANEAELVSQCSTFKTTIASAMNQLLKKQHQSLSNVESRLATMCERVDHYQKTIRRLKRLLNESTSERIADLEAKIANITEHRDAMVEALNGRIKGLEAELRDKDAEIVVLRKDRDAARDKEERSLRLADEKEQEAAELREHVETLNDRLATASTKLQELQEALKSKSNDSQSMVSELEDAKSQVAQLKQKIEDLQQSAEMQRLEEKKESAAFTKVLRELSEKKDVIGQKNARIAELEQEVDRLSGNVERLESVLATKEAQIAKMIVPPTQTEPEPERPPSNNGRGRGAGKRGGAKRKQEVVEHDQEPSDSEMDALVSAQMAVVGDENDALVDDGQLVAANDPGNKRRKRGGKVAKAEELFSEPLKPETNQHPDEVDGCRTTRSGAKVAPITRARARGRQRNNQHPSDVDEVDENADRSDSADFQQPQQPLPAKNTRKRGADTAKNVQTHLLPTFDGNDPGQYV